MQKQNDIRLVLSLAAVLSLTMASAQAQSIDTDKDGRQLVSPSEMPQQLQLNQELSKSGQVRNTSEFSQQSQSGQAGTYGRPLGQAADSIVLPPGIPEDVRVGPLKDVSAVQKGAMALLLGFNLLAVTLWLFVAAREETKMDRFFHGDPFGTGKVDPNSVAASPATRH